MNHERRLNTLYALAAGDALGAATEFQSEQEIRARFPQGLRQYEAGSPFEFSPGEATDDTQMVIATLHGFSKEARTAQESVQNVYNSLRTWAASSPPDIGTTTARALSQNQLQGGVREWIRSSGRLAANGGLMRVASCFIAGFTGRELTEQALNTTALTHPDPRSLYSCVLVSQMLQAISEDQSFEGSLHHALSVTQNTDAQEVLYSAGLLHDPNTVRGQEELVQASKEMQTRRQSALEEIEQRTELALARKTCEQSGYVLDTLQMSLLHAQRAFEMRELSEGIKAAAMLGEDSDTTACVTGALLGAAGLEIPDWLLRDPGAPLRLGHSFGHWQRHWLATEHFPTQVPKTPR